MSDTKREDVPLELNSLHFVKAGRYVYPNQEYVDSDPTEQESALEAAYIAGAEWAWAELTSRHKLIESLPPSEDEKQSDNNLWREGFVEPTLEEVKALQHGLGMPRLLFDFAAEEETIPPRENPPPLHIKKHKREFTSTEIAGIEHALKIASWGMTSFHEDIRKALETMLAEAENADVK